MVERISRISGLMPNDFEGGKLGENQDRSDYSYSQSAPRGSDRDCLPMLSVGAGGLLERAVRQYHMNDTRQGSLPSRPQTRATLRQGAEIVTVIGSVR